MASHILNVGTRWRWKKGDAFLKLRVILLKITKIFLTKGHSASSARGFDRIKLALFTNCCCSLFYVRILPD